MLTTRVRGTDCEVSVCQSEAPLNTIGELSSGMVDRFEETASTLKCGRPVADETQNLNGKAAHNRRGLHECRTAADR